MDWTTYVVWATGRGGKELEVRAAPLSRVSALFLREAPTLEGVPFEEMTALRELHVSDPAKNLRTLRGIERATKLVHLDCMTPAIAEIVPLGALVQLEWLSACSTKVGDLSPLASCTKLKTLHVAKNAKLRSVEPLAALRALEDVDLAGTLVKDIAPLAALPKLKELRVPRRLPKASLAAFEGRRRGVKISAG